MSIAGYDSALEAAGAKILASQSFGSYQGDWFAFVEVNGKQFWVIGSYGSCSGCDAFEGEFGYGRDQCDEHRYETPKPENCLLCNTLGVAYKIKLAEFGRGYLENHAYSTKEAVAYAEKNLDWDSEASEMRDFVQRVGREYGKEV